MFDWITKLNELKKQNTSFCLATIVQTKGSSPRKSGTRLIVEENNAFHGTIGGGNLEYLVLEKAKTCLSNKTEHLVHNFPLDEEAGQVCGGNVDVMFETFGNNPKLYIFGAGHVGLATSEILKDTLFDVHVIDDRENWIKKVKYAKTHKMNWKEFIEENSWSGENSYAVTMTPNHEFDQDIAFLLATKPLRYCGVIGSKNKWAHFKKELLKRGLTSTNIEKIKSPIGIVKAGNTPTEIAISLACELLDHYYNK